MVDLKLAFDEGIVLQTTEVERIRGNKDITLDEIYLTNKSIICVYEKSNGLFKKADQITETLPISSIKLVNGKAQIMKVDNDDYGLGLQILFNDGHRELFVFYDNKNDNLLDQWYTALVCTVSGEEIPQKSTAAKSKKVKELSAGAVLFAGVKEAFELVKQSVTDALEQDASSEEFGEDEEYEEADKFDEDEEEDEDEDEIDDEDEEEEVAPSPVLAASKTNRVQKFVFCTNCGAKIVDSDKFCSMCGAPTNIKQTQKMHEISNEEKPKETKKGSGKAYSGETDTCRLTVAEKKFTLRKNYIISDGRGKEIYTAKSEGLPKIPEIGIYKGDVRIGHVSKEWFPNPVLGNPTYTIHRNDECIGSLIQKMSLKAKFEIPENGWTVDVGVTKSTVYDANGAVAIKIKYVPSSGRSGFIVEYNNKKNEIPAILLTMVVVMVCHMG